MKDLVGKNSEKQTQRLGFSDLYEDLLDGSSFSLLSESDLSKLIKKKEINVEKLTDYYKRTVHCFYEERGKELIRMINSLVVSAYGKRLSSEKKYYSKTYKTKIKNYGNLQFLDQKESISPKHIKRLLGSVKRTIIPGQSSVINLRESSASMDKNSALKFRRFGKNFLYYKRVVNLILDYVQKVKEFAHKLNGHFDIFLKLNKNNKIEGWFHFKTMVYKDLMKILFKNHKVVTFLNHLTNFFNKNKFYASRFKSINRKLCLIDTHISAFSDIDSKKIDYVKDGQDIVQAVEGFKRDRKNNIKESKRRNDITNTNKKYMQNKNRLRIISDFGKEMITNSLIIKSEESNFENLKKMILNCYNKEHELFFQNNHHNRPDPKEFNELKNLSFSDLKNLTTLSQYTNRWFTFCIDCLNCEQRVSFLHLTKKLELTLSSVNNISKEYFSNSKKKGKQSSIQFQTNNRISNPYSFNKSELVQDHLASPDTLNPVSEDRLLELDSNQTKKPHTFRKRKKRKRRKRTKQTSPSIKKENSFKNQHQIKTLTSGSPNMLFSQFPNEKSAKINRSYSKDQRNRAITEPEKIKFNEAQQQREIEQIKQLEQIKKLKKDTLELIMGSIKNQNLWDDTKKKLNNKRRKDERSRKKGQRRNKKLRMNENLKAMKAYLEWNEALETKHVDIRLSAEGLWTNIQ